MFVDETGNTKKTYVKVAGSCHNDHERLSQVLNLDLQSGRSRDANAGDTLEGVGDEGTVVTDEATTLRNVLVAAANNDSADDVRSFCEEAVKRNDRVWIRGVCRGELAGVKAGQSGPKRAK